MADTPETPPQEAQAGQGPTLRILTQYTKDLSFENPNSHLDAPQQNPGIDIGVDVRATGIQGRENAFEVDLQISAKAETEGRVFFIAELVYSGVFEIQGVEKESLEPLILIECPRLLFPFARRILADVTREGGFPPLMLDPIDFAALYRQQKMAGAVEKTDAAQTA